MAGLSVRIMKCAVSYFGIHISLICLAAGTGGGGAWYGRGTGNIWLDQVRCQGYENALLSCPANPLGRDDCTHAEDAGVNCGNGNVENKQMSYKRSLLQRLVFRLC